MLEKFLSWHENLVVGHPRKLLAFLAVLFMLTAWQIPNVFIETSSDTLVLEGDDDLAFYGQVRDEFPESEFLIASYDPHEGDILEPANVARIARLVDRLGDIEGVSGVNSILDVPLLSADEDLLEADTSALPTVRSGNVSAALAAKEFRESSLYKNLIADEDLSVAAIQILLEENREFRDIFQEREDLRRQQHQSGLNREQEIALTRLEERYQELARIFQDERATLVAAVRAALHEQDDYATIFLGGVPMITADMVKYVRSDLIIFGLAVGVMVILLLIVIFRDWRWVVLPLLNCFAVAGFTMGLLVWVGWNLTIVSANFLLLLFILTLSLNVHLVVRFRELQVEQADLEHKELVRTTIRYMRTPCTYMVFTTLVSFVSLYFSQVRPVVDFGMMMGMSCLILLIWSFLLFPSTLVLIKEPPKVPSVLDPNASYTRFFAKIVEQGGSKIIWVSMLAVAIGLYGLTKLQVESRFIDYFDDDTEIHQGMLVIDQYLGGTIPFEVLLSADAGASAEDDDLDFAVDDQADVSPWFSNRGLKTIKQVHDYLAAQPSSGKVLSLATLYDIIEGFLGEPPDDVQLAVLKESLPDEVRDLLIRPYLSEDGTQARIAMRVKETSRDLVRQEYLDQVTADLSDMLDLPGEEIKKTGLLVLYNNLLQSLYRSQILTTGVVLLLVSAMFLVLFRSLPLALIALSPNLLASVMVIGGMGLVGIPLDMVTVVITALVIGIGVDDTVHYIWRYQREFSKTGNYLQTMRHCHGSVGRAIGYTSVTIVLGLMLLVMSNFIPSIRFGVLTSVAMTIALIATLTLLPQLIRVFKPFGPERTN